MEDYKNEIKKYLLSMGNEIDEFIPKKIEPYCSYSILSGGFDIATADCSLNDDFMATVSFDDVIKDFIERYSRGSEGLDYKSALHFIGELERAISIIRSERWCDGVDHQHNNDLKSK